MNWRQACVFLRCSKSTFYRLVQEGKIRMYGVGTRYRYVLKSDCLKVLQGEKEKATIF